MDRGHGLTTEVRKSLNHTNSFIMNAITGGTDTSALCVFRNKRLPISKSPALFGLIECTPPDRLSVVQYPPHFFFYFWMFVVTGLRQRRRRFLGRWQNQVQTTMCIICLTCVVLHYWLETPLSDCLSQFRRHHYAPSTLDWRVIVTRGLCQDWSLNSKGNLSFHNKHWIGLLQYCFVFSVTHRSSSRSNNLPKIKVVGPRSDILVSLLHVPIITCRLP